MKLTQCKSLDHFDALSDAEVDALPGWCCEVAQVVISFDTYQYERYQKRMMIMATDFLAYLEQYTRKDPLKQNIDWLLQYKMAANAEAAKRPLTEDQKALIKADPPYFWTKTQDKAYRKLSKSAQRASWRLWAKTEVNCNFDKNGDAFLTWAKGKGSARKTKRGKEIISLEQVLKQTFDLHFCKDSPDPVMKHRARGNVCKALKDTEFWPYISVQKVDFIGACCPCRHNNIKNMHGGAGISGKQNPQAKKKAAKAKQQAAKAMNPVADKTTSDSIIPSDQHTLEGVMPDNNDLNWSFVEAGPFFGNAGMPAAEGSHDDNVNFDGSLAFPDMGDDAAGFSFNNFCDVDNAQVVDFDPRFDSADASQNMGLPNFYSATDYHDAINNEGYAIYGGNMPFNDAANYLNGVQVPRTFGQYGLPTPPLDGDWSLPNGHPYQAGSLLDTVGQADQGSFFSQPMLVNGMLAHVPQDEQLVPNTLKRSRDDAEDDTEFPPAQRDWFSKPVEPASQPNYDEYVDGFFTFDPENPFADEPGLQGSNALEV